MTTRRAHRTLPRIGNVMDERITVTPRTGDAPPSAQEACRIGTMRRITAARLRYYGLEPLMSDVTLIVTELLTNALLHSGTTEIGLQITVDAGTLHISVRDGMPGAANPHPTHEHAESGRGLQIVAALVRDLGGVWGTRDSGAETWCDLALPAGAAA
ncbi:MULTISPECIES: ATP-binding protein [unclassified Streptomyces]|uniref:ATP-binding protein n=1 Tax=unclassified Streptomyces TaxID=2593676 RepID=UPI0036F63F5F